MCVPRALLVLALATYSHGQDTGWPFFGQNLSNTRSAPKETILGPGNVGELTVKWVFDSNTDVSATPSVDPTQRALYVPDYGGYLYKIDIETGKQIWARQMTADYGLPKGSISRGTPALAGDMVVIAASGTLLELAQEPALLAIDTAGGNVIWRVRPDENPQTLMTGSPIIYEGVVYVGISSKEEAVQDPIFRGNVAAFDLATGRLLWRQYMTPPGYAGAAVWSSAPAIDPGRGLLYVTTGNNYSVPKRVEECEREARPNPWKVLACQDPSNYFDSIVAMELKTGKIRWGTRLSADDNFVFTCVISAPSCPQPAGPDYDFGSGANLFTATIRGKPVDVVGAGQKSGRYWVLNRDSGAVVWSQSVGPGGLFGGIQWGTATDGRYVYAAEANTSHALYFLRPSGGPWNGGSWTALDVSTGNPVWQTPDPGKSTLDPLHPAMTVGPVTIANGVIYAPSLSGNVYALDAATGQILWSFDTGGSVGGGAAVVNGVVYWGSGYRFYGLGTSNHKLFAFALPTV